jgi:hypothetical protein
MRSDVMDENGIPLVAIHRADPAARADDANAFFEAAGLGRMWKNNRPPGVVVSMPCDSARSPTPRRSSSSATSLRFFTDLPSRSNFVTTRVSPSRR